MDESFGLVFHIYWKVWISDQPSARHWTSAATATVVFERIPSIHRGQTGFCPVHVGYLLIQVDFMAFKQHFPAGLRLNSSLFAGENWWLNYDTVKLLWAFLTLRSELLVQSDSKRQQRGLERVLTPHSVMAFQLILGFCTNLLIRGDPSFPPLLCCGLLNLEFEFKLDRNYPIHNLFPKGELLWARNKDNNKLSSLSVITPSVIIWNSAGWSMILLKPVQRTPCAVRSPEWRGPSPPEQWKPGISNEIWSIYSTSVWQPRWHLVISLWNCSLTRQQLIMTHNMHV